MKRILHTILLLLVTITTFAQTFKVRECTEGEIPLSVRGDYYKTVERYLDIYYQMLPGSIGNAENREAIISNVMANRDGKTLKTEFLLDNTKDLSFVSPMQYYVKFENVFSQMADEIEFVVDNVSPGKIMMNSLVSCFIPVDYDLTLMKGEDILFKRRCRMTFLFQKITISSIAKTMQVEPLKDIIAYVPKDLISKQMYEQAEIWYKEGFSQKHRYLPVFKSLAEKGYTDAEWRYGYCLLDENSTQHTEAVGWLQKAVDKNHPNAFNTLGWCYREGTGVSKNPQKAFELFKRSAELGWKNGMHNLADAYNNAIGCSKDVDKAMFWYEKAAENGYDEDYFNLALLYFQEKNDNEKGKQYLLKGYEKEEINCMRYLGLCYKLKLNSFPEDYDKAYSYLKQTMDWCDKNNWIKEDKQWMENTTSQFNEVKDWYKRKPEVLLDSLRQKVNDPYIFKAIIYKSKKKDKDKFDKVVAKWDTNPTKAMTELDKLVDAGMPEALEYKGNLLYKAEQYDLAYYSYAAASLNLTNYKALNGLGNCYFYGKHVAHDYKQAFRLYEKAHSLNPYHPQTELGLCYFMGLGTNVEYSKAVSIFLRNAHDAEVNAYLGECYDKGLGVKKDSIQAARWFEQSARKGSLNGMYHWGEYLYDGKAGQKDVQTAIKWWQKSADKGDIQSMKGLGIHFYDLNQYGDALNWFQMAAEKGDKIAQHWTGYLYTKDGTSFKSLTKAKLWYQKAAEQNYAQAQSELGYLLYSEKTEDSQKQAFEWWTKSALQKNSTAQYNLAVCYENGNGVARSMANAVKWYVFSAALKNGTAINRVKRLKDDFSRKNMNRQPVREDEYSGVCYINGRTDAGIFICVENTDVYAITDENGRFFLKGVKKLDMDKVDIIHPKKGYVSGQLKMKNSKGVTWTTNRDI